MTARELVERCRSEPHYQCLINGFVDDFRRAGESAQRIMAEDAPATGGEFAGLVAAVVDALCRECCRPVPGWAKSTRSPVPFFAFPATGYALRVRLMLESPPPFKARNVFVPESYLSRA